VDTIDADKMIADSHITVAFAELLVRIVSPSLS